MRGQGLIFGFMSPSNDAEIPSGFAITRRSTFRTERCMDDTYPNEFYRMFQDWQEMGIYELMESVFEFPESRRQYIERYLAVYGVQRCPEFEQWLIETM